MYKTGEEFLNKLYSDMHMDYIVNHKALKSDTPEEKISKYLDRLEKVHEEVKDNPHRLEMLLNIYYDKYVIKELPSSYINLQKEIYKEQGYGNIEIDNKMKEELLKVVQKDQKQSLKEWITYLTSDDAMYPMWFKNYAFKGMIKLGKFDKEKMKFTRRGKTTVEPYLELNREILAQIYDVIKSEIGKNEITEEQQEILSAGESFQKLYIYFLTKQNYKSQDKETDGIWIKYEQGSDSKKLCDSLQGKSTGWCTAGYETAKTQLDIGDFYIYYTKDEEGKYTNPRIAIRMNGKEEIGEVRGVSKNQNLEEEMTEIADKKLDEFKDKEKYQKKVHDMKLLTKIDKKVKENKELNKNELKFLYEIGSKIQGFGYEEDPRIEEIKSKRDIKEDLSIIFDCRKDQVGTRIEDFNTNDIVVYALGIVCYEEKVPNQFKHLKAIIGNADFHLLKDARGLNNLKYIGYLAVFESLEDAKGLESLEYIGLSVRFNSLKDARGLNSLQYIGGDAFFNSLKDAQGLNNLKYIGWNAYFKSLKTAQGLNKLEYIGGFANFPLLKNAEGLERLENIKDDAYFNSLKDAQGLNNLKYIGGKANFHSLKIAEGLNNLKYIGDYANFEKLKNAQGLNKLEYIFGDAYFESLEDTEGLNNLKYVGLNADFESLKDSQGLNNIECIGGTADFESLKDARGLNNLKYIGGYYFKSLLNAEPLKNCNKYDEIKKEIEKRLTSKRSK